MVMENPGAAYFNSRCKNFVFNSKMLQNKYFQFRYFLHLVKMMFVEDKKLSKFT